MTKCFIVIGNGGFGASCLRALLNCHQGIIVPLVVSDPEARAMPEILKRTCDEYGVEHVAVTNINSIDLIERIRSFNPDYLFSIYNMRIFKQELLNIPRLGTINFHNGPLPRYRGVNVYSWAIINGESEYGVTWHVVDRKIDTGDILAQSMFSIDPCDTPSTLMVKGFRNGLQLLENMLPALVCDALNPRKQDESLSSYYSKLDLPNGGRLSLEWPFDCIERFVRGLDFRPLPNSFVLPTAFFRGVAFHPQTVARLSTEAIANPGRVMDVNYSCIRVTVADGTMGMSDLLDSDHKPVSPHELQQRLGISVGDFLDAAPPKL